MVENKITDDEEIITSIANSNDSDFQENDSIKINENVKNDDIESEFLQNDIYIENDTETLDKNDINFDKKVDDIILEKNQTKTLIADEFETIFVVKPKEEKQNISVNQTFFDKIKHWSHNHLEYIISLSIIIALLFGTLIFMGDEPFGNKTFLISDSYEQVAVFFNHFFDVIEGKATLLYSNYFAKGIEMFSTLEYMYLNPFYIIAIFGGRQNIYLMLTFSTLLMIIFNAIIFLWFSRKYFKNLSSFVRILISILFVFSGYLNYNYSFSTWLIYPAITLILIDRFISFTKTGKKTSLIFTLIWYVITCYSVGISTMFIIILLAVAYTYIFVEKEQRPKMITDIFVVFAVAGLASLVILFPSIMGILNTSRSSSTIKNLVGNNDSNYLEKLGTFFFDAIPVILTFIYFIKCNKKEKFNKFLLFTAIILFIPVFFDSVLRLLCFSMYQGFHSRFYFLNEILLFSAVQLLFDKELLKFKKSESKFLSNICTILFCIALVITFIIFEFDKFYDIGRNVKTPIYKGSDLTLIFAIIFALILIIMALVYILNNKKILSVKNSKAILSILLILSCCFNFFTFLNHAGDPRDSDIEKIIVESGVEGNIKILGDKYDYNIYNVRIGDVRFPTAFTSLISKEVTESYKKLDYPQGSTHVDIKLGSIISDSIIGVDYYFTCEEQDRPYMEFVKNIGKYYIYKNKLATNGTFIINSEFSFKNNISYYENLQNLAEYYGISGKLFTEIDFEKEIDVNSKEDKASVKLSYTSTQEGILYSIYYIESQSDTSASIEKYNYVDNYACKELAYLKAGEDFEYEFDAENYTKDKESIENIKGYFLNYDMARQLCEKLQEKQATFEYKPNGYEINFELQDNEKLYVMVPSINGLSYKLNGTEIEANYVLGYMGSFESTENQNTLIANYEYPYLIIWLEFAIIAIVVMVAILLIYHYTKFKHIQKLIYRLMSAIAIFIIVIIYIMGTMFSIVWFFV